MYHTVVDELCVDEKELPKILGSLWNLPRLPYDHFVISDHTVTADWDLEIEAREWGVKSFSAYLTKLIVQIHVTFYDEDSDEIDSYDYELDLKPEAVDVNLIVMNSSRISLCPCTLDYSKSKGWTLEFQA